jgi:hypothetical protein
MSTCDRLDLQTPGSQPIMPKNLPNHRVDPFREAFSSTCVLGTRI